MKKLVIIILFSLTTNAQYKYTEDVYFGENKNDGSIVNLITGEELCSDNSICVEIDLKKATVEIVNFGEVRIYDIYNVEVLGDGYNNIYCSSDQYQDIEVGTIGLSISVIYDNTIMAFAEYPLNIQLKRSEETMNDPLLNKENGTFKPN